MASIKKFCFGDYSYPTNDLWYLILILSHDISSLIKATYICFSACLSSCYAVCLSVCLSVFLFVRSSISFSVCMAVGYFQKCLNNGNSQQRINSRTPLYNVDAAPDCRSIRRNCHDLWFYTILINVPMLLS